MHFTSEVASWQWTTTAAGQHSLRLDRRQAIELFLAAPLVLAVGGASEVTVDQVLGSDFAGGFESGNCVVASAAAAPKSIATFY